jgi:FtsH-binding integral membrane protein
MGYSYSSFAPAIPVRSGADRATLVRRTYGLVLAGILVTVLGAAFAVTQPALYGAVADHSLITFFCALIPLWLAMRNHRSFPRNLAYTFLFTFVEGVWLSPLLLTYERLQPGILSQAGMLTLSTFGVLTLYAVVSKRDFSAWGGFFMIGLWVLIGTSILNMFFHNTTAALWIAGATIFVFGGLLVFDTWRIVRSGQYGPDDYVLAAVQIYLDLLNIFLAILNVLFGNRRS